MMPFTSLDDWSLESIRNLLARGGEPGWYDWKEVLRLPKDAYSRICAIASGMANTEGGYIVFGVKDKGATPNDRIVGIELDNEDGHHFGQVIGKVRPNVRFTVKPIKMDSSRGVFVVHIPQSQRRPHMNEHDWKFYQRGDGGNVKAMEYQQVRDLMLLVEERRQRIALLATKVAQYRLIADDIDGFGGSVHQCFDRFDTSFFDTLLIDVWGALPAGPLLTGLMRISQIANRVNSALNLASTASGNGMLQGLEQIA